MRPELYAPDLQLSEVIQGIFTAGQRYPNEQHFLLDDSGNLILAGAWQAEIENDNQTGEQALAEAAPELAQWLQHMALPTAPQVLDQDVSVNGKRYILLGALLEPMGWRYFRLVPVADMLAGSRDFFLLLLGVLLINSILIGLIIRAAVDRGIVRRMRRLEAAMRGFDIERLPVPAVPVGGRDEIAQAARTFEHVAGAAAREHAELRQQLSAAALMRQVFDSTEEAILITDPDQRIVDVNPAFTRMSGYPPEEVLGRRPALLKSGLHGPEFYAALWQQLQEQGYWCGEIWNRRSDGTLYPVWNTISAVRDEAGRVVRYVGIASDISTLKQHERQLEYIAFHDALTGLPNRALLADRIQGAIARAQREEKLLAICYLDLDGFKPINDVCGHEAGDAVLRQVAERLRQAVRETDTVARLGGDEFVLLLERLGNIQECEGMLARAMSVLRRKMVMDDREFTLSASIGVVVYPLDDVEDADALLRHADQAMYVAKQEGKNRHHFYDARENRAAQERRTWLEHMRAGLARGEFELYYQPKVRLADMRPLGAEALIRWQHPERGLLLPGEFLPLIAHTDVEITLGNWVISAALAQLDAWRKEGLMLEVGINIAGEHLLAPGFTESLQTLLAQYPAVPAASLQIEILETSALEDMERVGGVISACRRLGVSFALDDFGTGYSSLAYLRNLPFQTLKIDRSFVRDMLDDAGDRAIVRGVITLAGAFGRGCVAEGIERRPQLDLLREMGCEIGQGYGIAHPMMAGEFGAWMRARVPVTS